MANKWKEREFSNTRYLQARVAIYGMSLNPVVSYIFVSRGINKSLPRVILCVALQFVYSYKEEPLSRFVTRLVHNAKILTDIISSVPA